MPAPPSPGSEFAAYCVELLGTLGAARAKRMFGGHGLYVDEIFIALVANDRLYLKVDAQTQPRFEAAGCMPFVYNGGGDKHVTLGYWTAPDDALESPALLQPWARLALEAAVRARAAKAPKPKKPTPKKLKPSPLAGAKAAPATPKRAARPKR